MIIHGDSRQLPLRDGCVQCCVTSPPYWGLRDYGTATWLGGNPDCQHVGQHTLRALIPDTASQSRKQWTNKGSHGLSRGDCACGAVRVDAQIGLEFSPAEYVSNLLQVFREVRRVLRDDGVLWLNLGDSYASSTKGTGGATLKQSTNTGSFYQQRHFDLAGSRLKAKDLAGIPWQVALALRDDGWWLRSDIIWHKPNVMPQSMTDRPTTSHEYVFLLAKSERYYFDADAVREPGTGAETFHCGPQTRELIRTGHHQHTQTNPEPAWTRNVRTVWTIPTQSYHGAHLATFPEALVERCVLASTRNGDLVLDPFGGSGTTSRVAYSLGRRGVGVDINPAYLALARERTQVTLGLPLEFDRPGREVTA